MATQVVMPKLSPTMEEGQLSRWLKKEGDKVSMGEPLAEIDTDKATMEMQALSTGVLRKILINEGDSAPLGQPIAIIGEPDEDISELLKGAQAAKPAKAEAAPAKLPESEAAPAVETASAAKERDQVRPSIAPVSLDGQRAAEAVPGGLRRSLPVQGNWSDRRSHLVSLFCGACSFDRRCCFRFRQFCGRRFCFGRLSRLRTLQQFGNIFVRFADNRDRLPQRRAVAFVDQNLTQNSG